MVNVQRAGIYTIATDTVNGMTFGSNGVFSRTGIQSLVLRGTGTPVRPGIDSLTVRAGGSYCRYGLKTDSATGTNPNPTGPTAADSTWSFSQGTLFFHGGTDSTFFDTLPAPAGDTIAIISGGKYPTYDSGFVIYIPAPGKVIKPGTYNTNSINRTTSAAFSFLDKTGVAIYDANISTVGKNITVVVAYDAATKTVSGTFTGTASNAAGASVPITNGKFKSPLE